MNTHEKLSALRAEMERCNIDAWVVPSSDPHMSEYVSSCWLGRKWLSGFSGSAGTVVVLKEQAGLWTDGRYHIQAAMDLAGTGIELFKAGLPEVTHWEKWLVDTLPSDSVIGFYGATMALGIAQYIEGLAADKGIGITQDCDLLEVIWDDRPSIPDAQIFEHDLCFAGKSRAQKLEDLRQSLKDAKAEYTILNPLDDIAWLYNFRGKDVTTHPVAHAYTIISQESAELFIQLDKVPAKLAEDFQAAGIHLREYTEVFAAVAAIPAGSSVFIDPKRLSSLLFKSIAEDVKVLEGQNLTLRPKAIKNSTELANYRECLVTDGLAMVKFLKWLDEEIPAGQVTEQSATDKLLSLREDIELFHGVSFTTIPGYMEHGAMMHYSVTPESDVSIEPRGLFLVDSGGLYSNGTTDITRTIVCGDVSDAMKRHFTLVLKGFVSLSRAVFLNGTRGVQLDILARGPMWRESINYGCGTGHGVGFFLNVHEGPHNVGPRMVDEAFLPGMVVTNEPGIYLEGEYGIRIENIMEIVEHSQSAHGKFNAFKWMTLCPIDLRAVEKDMLSPEEVEWINQYHADVYDQLSPKLDEAECAWLQQACKSF